MNHRRALHGAVAPIHSPLARPLERDTRGRTLLFGANDKL
jgi:hypothetical protein